MKSISYLWLLLLLLEVGVDRAAGQKPDYWTGLKNQPNLASLGVKDQPYNALCNGSSDDSAAVQAAINAAAAEVVREVLIVGNCNAHNLYIPSTAAGLHLRCVNTNTNSGTCLTANGAGAVLSIYAFQVVLYDVYINCNSTASVGFLFVAAAATKTYNTRAFGCLADGRQRNPAGGPATTLATSVSAGAVNPTLQVVNAALTGYPLSGSNASGGRQCTSAWLDYSTVNQELVPFSRSGNNLTVTGTLAHSHNIGAGVTCNGNNDRITEYSPQGYNNAGWCDNFFAATDNNGIKLYDSDCQINGLGGILMSGSVNQVFGINSEGNTGPMIQLGDIDGGSATNGVNGRVTYYTTIMGIGDTENTSGNNLINAVCAGLTDNINYYSSDQLKFFTGGFCPALPAGNGSLGFGSDLGAGNVPQFTVKTASGKFITIPGVSSYNYNAAGVLQHIPGVWSTNDVNGQGTSIYSTNYGIAGTGSANNALIYSNEQATGSPGWKDAAGNALAPQRGTTFDVFLNTKTLRAGANTITINGTSYAIKGHYDNADITHAYTSGVMHILLVYNSDNSTMLDMSQ